MQYKVVCKSPLLQHTLEYFLKDHLNDNGIIITDNPEIEGILIGKDIKKPFTKTTLYMQLEKFIPIQKEMTLEEKIEIAIDKFKEELLNIIKEHYGKK
jgi:hypothetical protein